MTLKEKHENKIAPAHQRTSAPAHNALAAALIAAGLLSLSPDGFAADVTVSTEQQYKDALQNPDAYKIFINQNITLTPQNTSTYLAAPRTNTPSPGHFSLEGNWDGSAPLFALIGSGSSAGSALTNVLDNGFFTADIDTIKNLAVRNFARHYTSDTTDGIFTLGNVTGGIHNVHFENNSSNFGSGALSAESVDGGINGSRFIGNRSFTDAALVVRNLVGGLNDSVFIGNRLQLPDGFPALPVSYDAEINSAAALSGDVQLRNNIFLGNTSNMTNAQNPTLGAHGAALIHATNPASPATSAVTLSADTGKRTLFYGNTHNAGSGHAPSGIRFESLVEYTSGNMPPQAGDPTTVNLAVQANGGNILMLDPISAQADNLPDRNVSPWTVSYQGANYGSSNAYEVKFSNLTVNVNKTGASNWFLGGKSELPGASNWNINDGSLTLTTVNYGGTGALGTLNAGVNLSNATTANFTLGSGATLAGSGNITAKNITLNGAVRPGTWVNTGTLASNITNGISDADIAAIDVVQNSPYGTLVFTGDVAMSGAKIYANVGNVVTNPADKNLLDVSGNLTLNGSANELHILVRSDADLSSVALIHAGDGITGAFSNSNVFFTAPTFLNLAPEHSQTANDVLISTTPSLAWDSADTGVANGTFDLSDFAGSSFSVTTALAGTNKPLTVKGASKTLYLNAANTYTGPTSVDSGTLRVGETEALGATASVTSHVTVEAGATVGGHGTYAGGLTLKPGAIVSPGASIGDMHVIGNIGSPGTIYEFEVNPNGAADHLIVTGLVDLAGSTLRVLHGGGSGVFAPSTTYAGIIQASGGVNNTFDTIDNHLPLMTAALTYHPDAVDLTLSRNNVSFAAMGLSANQVNLGLALDSLGNHVVANTVAMLPAADIRIAMDNLSGEIYGSTRSALLDNHALSNAVQSHMLRLADDRLAAAQPVLLASSAPTPVSRPRAASQQLWVSTWGNTGRISGNHNAAKIKHHGFGLALGADMHFNDSLSGGLVFGYEDARVKNGENRSSRSDIDAYSLGAWLGGDAGSVQWRAGLSYSWLDIETKRNIAVRGLQSTAKAKYRGHKTQAFAEVSKGFQVNDSTRVSPYAGVTHTWLSTRGARETGSVAALDISAQRDHVTHSDLGVRVAYQLPDSTTSLSANLGWKHAFGNTSGKTSNRFADAGNRFTVQGTEVAKNTAQAGLGVQAQLGQNTTINVGYEGSFASKVSSHSAGVQVKMQF